MTRPGDTVAVESPTFYGVLQVLETLGLRALEIPTSPATGLSIGRSVRSPLSGLSAFREPLFIVCSPRPGPGADQSTRRPSATASAVQVRQPIHGQSVGLWRRYAGQLDPLRAALTAGGVDPQELL